MRPVVEEVGPDNVVAFCTDGGSNYAVACNELIAEWPHIQHVPCATHVLDLFMEDVGKMTWAKKVVDTVGEISSFVRNHHWTRGYMRTPGLVGAKMLQALKPAGTRFGTQYIVVSRLCELRQSLAQMVVSDVLKGWVVGDRKKSADKFASQVLDDAWWRTAEFFSKLMKLPFMAMRKTDGDAKGMMGRMYDVMLQLTEDVGTVVEEDEEQLSYSDKVNIRRLLKNRWDDSLACPMHIAGRILNPANQDEDIFGSDAECTKVFKTYITQHAEHLCNYGKEGDDGDDIGEVLMELQDGVLVLNGSLDRETAGMAASDFVLAICNCLNRTFGDDSSHRLTHSSMHYVTHLIAPEGGAIPLDHERLTYLGVTSVTMVPSLTCESSTGVHYDVHALVTTLKDLLTKQMASQVTT
ncbi:unnamed protein product [Closterium sp. NIES-64]|nr:unnamed protein product [Closterium sp. NIES-64]